MVSFGEKEPNNAAKKNKGTAWLPASSSPRSSAFMSNEKEAQLTLIRYKLGLLSNNYKGVTSRVAKIMLTKYPWGRRQLELHHGSIAWELCFNKYNSTRHVLRRRYFWSFRRASPREITKITLLLLCHSVAFVGVEIKHEKGYAFVRSDYGERQSKASFARTV